MTTSHSRRGFLKLSAQAGMLSTLSAIGLLGARPAQAAVSDYKALVCLYMFGGNDGNNMIVPLDGVRYPKYQQIRGSAGLALSTAANTLCPGRSATTQAVANPVNQPFAFHYGMPEIDALYGQGQVACVLNMGSLTQPLTKAQYVAGVAVPPQLFSHPDQTLQNQAGSPAGAASGWGGRLVDALGTGGHLDAVALGTGGLFIEGKTTHGNQLPQSGQLSLAGMNFWPASEAKARQDALRAILSANHPNLIADTANKALLQGMDLVTDLAAANSGGALSTPFPGTSIGVQLRTVAQLIKLRQTQGPGRQVFFVSQGGFDTHGGQAYQQFDMLRQVSAAVAAFQLAMAEIGALQNVTTFTMSDFGRTLMPNSGGTDHAWGNHHLVISGAVKGGLYGAFPDFTLGGQDDATGRGAWIPQISNQQFGATIGKWFGADPDTLANQVFKNELGNFPVTDLGFLN
ncbi:DUF1501 domain-containing protein [Massilia sp. TS11]|uniref:DUF1501 domain-containing protein n=1 Tax=Massilia sp. TS11 TaxID=2908003 RepID=UPI001EDB6E01|nr:DUF1501 domain-containing protein [Massilia sp. TS11]MCG2585777.1 DUF1501 domain-containing protein [Massilia sp. TS11]